MFQAKVGSSAVVKRKKKKKRLEFLHEMKH